MHDSRVRMFVLSFVVLTIFGVVLTYRYHTRSNLPLCADCNVIIIGVDALGAGHVSHLGNKNETTPTIDRFAEKGTSFREAISPASWTVPAFMSVFTGLFPSEHHVVNKFSEFSQAHQVQMDLRVVSPTVETLADEFKANGYMTGGFTGDAGVGRQFGYEKGFDIYTDEKTFGSIGNSAAHALKWIGEHKDQKLFIFLHGYDDHGQFSLPEDYHGRFMPDDYKGNYKGTPKEQRLLREKGLADGSITLTDDDVRFWRGWYDSKIRDADDRLAAFWDAYQQIGIGRRTIVVILADHGTEFYEHKRFDHGFSLYDELIHVPLVFAIPGISPKGPINEQVTTLDIAPTLLDLTGITPSTTFAAQQRGKSLLRFLVNGSGEGEDVFSETDYRNYTHKRSLRTQDGWKYILTLETGKEELYHLEEDPAELHDVAQKNPEITMKLAGRVREHLIRMGDDPAHVYTVGCVPVYGDQCK